VFPSARPYATLRRGTDTPNGSDQARQFLCRTVVIVGFDRADVLRAMEAILPLVPQTEFRLVGTASCLLRGIEMEANDVDVLFRERGAIDEWSASLSGEVEVTDSARWLAEGSQYFARLNAAGVTVELSTVEIEVDFDTGECVGSGPWVHFDLVPCGKFSVPTVALELRLVTEVARRRADRWKPIAAYFRSHPCDVGLVERGLFAYSTPHDEIAALVASLSAE